MNEIRLKGKKGPSSPVPGTEPAPLTDFRRTNPTRPTEFRHGGLNHASDEALATHAKNLKHGIMKVINMPESKRMKDNPEDPHQNPPFVSFHANRMMLHGVEAEIRRRGYNPSHPDYGPDLTGQIEDVKKHGA